MDAAFDMAASLDTTSPQKGLIINRWKFDHNSRLRIKELSVQKTHPMWAYVPGYDQIQHRLSTGLVY